jgi:transposase
MDGSKASTDTPACPGCIERDRRIAQLEERLADALKRIDHLEQVIENLQRRGKRQAAPFAKRPPKTDPKTPGRKSGDDYGTKAFRALPPRIDETYDAPLPNRCPSCGGGVTETRVAQQYQVEIPRRPIYRQFNVHLGQCVCCGKSVQGRHELQTSDALGCCASQVGPDAQAAVVSLNKQMGLSHGKISRLFQALFGIQLTRGGACQIMLRAADRCEPDYGQIIQQTQASSTAVPDETGWRIGGRSAWLHVAVTPRAVAYLVHARRGFEAMALLLGKRYAGKLTHDGWAPYDRFFDAIHQACLGHLLCRCKELLETASRGAVVFPRKVKQILQQALAVRDRRDAGLILPATAARWANELDRRIEALVRPIKFHVGNERFARHLWRYRGQLFTFLRHADVDATNHLAEQAIRPAVVNRKVWGGNRTEAGAAAQSILMSVLATAAKLHRPTIDYISHVLRCLPGQPPTLVIDSG